MITIIFSLVILGCSDSPNDDKPNTEVRSEPNKSDEISDWNFKEYLSKQISYPLETLKLKRISQLNSETLRVWRFPGGGAAFEQLLEYNKQDSELNFHSYVLEDFKDIGELKDLNYTKVIKDNLLIDNLKSIVSKFDLLKTQDSEQYCEGVLGCADVYLVEYTNGEQTNKFIINHNIEECDVLKAEGLKKIFVIMQRVMDAAYNG
ncbi:hypothetical protein [Fulvivirga ligni]|uniref:hypothetical protein n=1 Tax=Fulvivirga ligni TaxID=2904246 RepID=UPI001F27E5AF|nr:hypothetical protein [Fulvivirga ligni]UII20563.1 hypothetical protein LVD16_22235 [Fulvivirga ligni]